MKKLFYLFVLISVTVCRSYAKTRSLKKDTIVFSGNSSIELAKRMMDYLGEDLSPITIGKFNDGEIKIEIDTNARDKDVFIIHSTCSTDSQSVNDSLIELFLLIRTLKRSSARSISVIVPYYGYARQDRKIRSRVPISAADIAQLIETAGADRVVSIDLHCGQIQGFFQHIPADNLYASSVFVPYLSMKDLKNPVIVSPDAGGVDRADQFAKQLARKGWNVGMAIISKQRAGSGKIKSMQLIGDVEGSDAIIVDDICDTAGTLVKAAQLLKDSGARKVFAIVTHPVFSNNALERIKESPIDEMIVSDTIPLRGEVPKNITVISVSSLLGEAIYRIQNGQSISELFKYS